MKVPRTLCSAVAGTPGYAVTSAAPSGTHFIFTTQRHDARFDKAIENALNWEGSLGARDPCDRSSLSWPSRQRSGEQ